MYFALLVACMEKLKDAYDSLGSIIASNIFDGWIAFLVLLPKVEI